jgi:CheY-like chemotaxis protein
MAHDILIVDDEADIRELVAGILEDEGYATRAPPNDADEALAAIARAGRNCGARHLAAGKPARRPAAARIIKARASRSCRS